MKTTKSFSVFLLIFLNISIPALCQCDCTNVAATGVSQIECEALLAFYYAMDGESSEWGWAYLWNTTSPVSDWFGLTTENGHVIGLTVAVIDHLKGPISPELGKLVYLERLDFSRNEITGSIPAELGNLAKLEYLDLGFNELEGSIPPEMGSMANLKYLDLGVNNLSGVIPPELAGLADLEHLYLSRNELQGPIPPGLGNLVNLKFLALGINNLSGVIPPELGNLPNLEYLDLSYNLLEGSIPTELGNLFNLKGLALGNTVAIPVISLTPLDMARQESPGLHGNQLGGAIPPELGNLVKLETLDLSLNHFSGTFPPQFGNLTNLTWLNLSSNQLEGSLPPEVGGMASLEYLDLSSNKLEGGIPAEIGNLANLWLLHLNQNCLTGAIPPELENLKNLEGLYLSDNQLEGSLPPELGNVMNLRSLNLSNINLEGLIPPEIGNLVKLRVLDLSRNRLSGAIPPEIGNLVNLINIYLDGNMLCGPIPNEIMNLESLCWLDDGLEGFNSQAGFNLLYTDDPEVELFMNDKFYREDGDTGNWSFSQTLPPDNVEVELLDYLPPAEPVPGEKGIQGSNRVMITWDPILFQANDGGYEACLKETSGGPCLAGAGITGDKSESSLVLSGLKPNTEYFIELSTRSYPCEHNPNTLTSTKNDTFSLTTGEASVTAFPLWVMRYGNFTGMAFSNYSSVETGISLTAYDAAGQVQTVPVNPSRFSLPAGQQKAHLGTEFFGVTPDIPQKVSWVEAASDQLTGSFFTFGSSDMRMLDGAVTQSRPSRLLWFSRPLASGFLSGEESAETQISLINPMDDPVELTLSLIKDGETVKEENRAIAGKGMLLSNAGELFGSVNLPEDCYLEVKVTDGMGLIGFSRMDFPVNGTTLGMNAAEPSSAETLYSAQLASGPAAGGSGMETCIRLINPLKEEREITFRAIAENGTLLADPVIRIMGGQTAAEFKAWELFDFEGEAAIGSLVIDVNAGGVVGDVVFTPFSGIEFAAAMPLQTNPVTEAVFNHIASSDEIYTGLAFFNPNPDTAQITIIAKRGNGTVSGTKQLLLGPGERISRILKDQDMLPGTASQLDGFISIVSTKPIICQQLFGGTDLQFLAAVPPSTGYGEMFE